MVSKVSLSLAALLLAGSLSACESRPDSNPPAAPASSQSPSDAPAEVASEDVRAAETTLQAFFAVRARAEDPISVKIDEQEKYLTARTVHPTAAYEDSMGSTPLGVEERKIAVELGDAQVAGATIKIPFKTKTESFTYPSSGGELLLDQGSDSYSHWDGTATLVEVNGEWLIDELTMESIGGGTGSEN